MTRPGRSRTLRVAERLIGEGTVVLVVLGWWVLSTRFPDYVLPSPAAVASRLAALFTDPDFIGETALSAARVVGSVAIATAAGTALALVARLVPVLEWVVERRIQPLLNSFPSVGWAILAVTSGSTSPTSRSCSSR